jgi:hypothetical protein
MWVFFIALLGGKIQETSPQCTQTSPAPLTTFAQKRRSGTHIGHFVRVFPNILHCGMGSER